MNDKYLSFGDRDKIYLDNPIIEMIKDAIIENYTIKKEVRLSFDIVNDIKYEREEIFEYLMSDPSETTFSISFNGEEYTNCSFAISKDGKRMEWFNDENNGVIEVK